MNNADTENWIVIPATGKGQRMQADTPKQYLSLGPRTILEHTLDNLLSHQKINGAVIVIGDDDAYWHKLNYRHSKPVLVCTGGAYRFLSVYQGLLALQNQSKEDVIVLIHDAVRPFVSHNELDELIQAASEYDDGVILANPITDTLKKVNDQNIIQSTHPREQLWRALTPQVFRLSVILKALEWVISQGLKVTDDASAMELAGYKPRIIPGDSKNIKITRPEDLILAERLLNPV